MDEDVLSIRPEEIVEMYHSGAWVIRLQAKDLTEVTDYYREKMEKNPEYFGFLIKEWMDKRNRRAELMPYFGDNIFKNIRAHVWFVLARMVYSRKGMVLFQ